MPAHRSIGGHQSLINILNYRLQLLRRLESSQEFVIVFVMRHLTNEQTDEVNYWQEAKYAAKRDQVEQDQHWATAQVNPVNAQSAQEKYQQDGYNNIVVTAGQTFQKHGCFLAEVFNFCKEAEFFRFFLCHMPVGGFSRSADLHGGVTSSRSQSAGSERRYTGQGKYRQQNERKVFEFVRFHIKKNG